MPPRHQPGEEFPHGSNHEILGYLVEVVSCERLGQFPQERIFTPLWMRDTALDVPAEKMNRLAKTHALNKEGSLTVCEEVLVAAWAEAGHGMESGGGGLFATAGEYGRFSQML